MRFSQRVRNGLSDELNFGIFEDVIEQDDAFTHAGTFRGLAVGHGRS